jgi:uncharacterized protein YkwD
VFYLNAFFVTTAQHMKRLHIIFIGAIFIPFIVLASGIAQSEEAFTDEMEAQLLEWINSARANPLEMAEAVGLDPDQVLADLPELYDVLTQGIAPLRSDSALTAAARSHTQDMLENDFYGHDSSDGSTPVDRVLKTGYVAEITDESLGILGFFNFIDPAEAVFRVFSTLYKGELKPERSRARNILNPEFEDVGIGFGAGKLTLQGVPYNVYLVTCDFGTRVVSVLELELVELINQARERPLDVAESLGLNRDEILDGLPELADILLYGLPPLTLNENLYGAAEDHALDMMENGYVSTTSLDGREVGDRVWEQGYDPLEAGESLRILVTVNEMDPREAARICLEKLLGRELAPGFMGRNILNPAFKEVGIRFETAVPAEADGEQDRLYPEYYTAMLVCDFGVSLEDQGMPYLKGRVYTDWDGNGLYSLGEGMDGIGLNIRGADTDFEVYTNPAGGFSQLLEAGVEYGITPLDDIFGVERIIEMGAENQSMDFIIEAETLGENNGVETEI